LSKIGHESNEVLTSGALIKQLKGLHSPVGNGNYGGGILDLLRHLENRRLSLHCPPIFPPLVIQIKSHLIDEYDLLFLLIFQPMVWQKPLKIQLSLFLVFKGIRALLHPPNPLVGVCR